MLKFNIDEIAHKVTAPFEGKLDKVAGKIDQSNAMLAELLAEQRETNALLAQLLRDK